MVYLIDCFVMRNFAYKNPDYIKNEVVPELIEDNPCYQQSVYDTVMYDESLDGDLIQCDMKNVLIVLSPVIVRLCLNVRLFYSSWLVRSLNYRLTPNLCWQSKRQRRLRIPHLPLLNNGTI